jgi:hypothetical protein
MPLDALMQTDELFHLHISPSLSQKRKIIFFSLSLSHLKT